MVQGKRETLVIPRALTSEMIEHARSAVPAEACGLIAGQRGRALRLYPVPNADACIDRYDMEPRAQVAALQDIEQHGWDLLAIYHSHTHSPAYPSPTDVSLAYYPDIYYAIVSLQNVESPQICAFSIANGRIQEVKVQVLE